MNEITPAGVPSLGELVEALTGDRADVASLARVLTGTLSAALPPDFVDIEYVRSMGDRVHGRPGVPVAVTVNVGDKRLTLRQFGRVHTEATITHLVRGVALSRETVPVTTWVTALAAEVRKVAAEDAAALTALHQLLLG